MRCEGNYINRSVSEDAAGRFCTSDLRIDVSTDRELMKVDLLDRSLDDQAEREERKDVRKKKNQGRRNAAGIEGQRTESTADNASKQKREESRSTNEKVDKGSKRKASQTKSAKG